MRTTVERTPKKLSRTKIVSVRAHERLIHNREYYFICKRCNRDVVRESFGGRPLYCLRCHPPKSQTKSETQRKKLPDPCLCNLILRIRATVAENYSKFEDKNWRCIIRVCFGSKVMQCPRCGSSHTRKTAKAR
jgi:Zn finger protein HypA/HybF involved in hydrogenase expression